MKTVYFFKVEIPEAAVRFYRGIFPNYEAAVEWAEEYKQECSGKAGAVIVTLEVMHVMSDQVTI